MTHQITTKATSSPPMDARRQVQTVCSCGFTGIVWGGDADDGTAAMMARMDGLQHAIEIATEVLRDEFRPRFM